MRRKRDIQEIEEEKGCNITNGILIPGRYIYLQNCSRLECLFSRGDFYPVIVSCPPNKVDIPTGCEIVSNFDAHYPECCEVVMECKKVIKKFVPVVYTAANMSIIDINAQENMISDSKTNSKNNLELNMDTSETKRSRRIADTKIVSKDDLNVSNSSTVEETSKKSTKNLNESQNKKTERKSKVSLRTATRNESKPSFFLSGRKRTSRNRRIDNNDKQTNDTVEFKNTIFITVSPTDSEITGSNKNSRPVQRRRLSSLLSSRNLRANTTLKPNTESIISKDSNKTDESTQNKLKINQSDIDTKQRITTSKSRKEKRAKSTIKIKNETLPEKVVKRRNVYTHRLNKYIAKIGNNQTSEESSRKSQIQDKKPKKKTSLKKRNKKIKGKSKKKKKKSLKNKKKTMVKPEEKEIKAKTDLKTSLRRRLSSRSKTSVLLSKPEQKDAKEEESKSEKRKQDESKTVTVKSRANLKKDEKPEQKENKTERKKQDEPRKVRTRSRTHLKKEEQSHEEKKKNETKENFLKEDSKKVNLEEKKQQETNPKVQKERKNSQRNLKRDKKVELAANVKKTSRRRKTKPTFELKNTVNDTDNKKEKESERGKTVFDSSKLNNNEKKESLNQATKRTRSSTRGRISRRPTIKSDIKVKEKEEEEEKEKEPEESKPKNKSDKDEINKEKQIEIQPTPKIVPKLDFKNKENEIPTISSDFGSLYNPDFSFPSNLYDFGKYYKYPIDDLEISSSDKEDKKSPNMKENEIIDIPETPKVPMKITTVSFSTSRRSYKSSKTRNTSKNFKEIPPVYDKKETFKAETFIATERTI